MYAPDYQTHHRSAHYSSPSYNTYEGSAKASTTTSEAYDNVENSIQKSLRVNFTRKVFAITATQLLATAIIAHFFVNHKWFFRINYYFSGLVHLAGIVALVTSLALGLSQYLSRKVPLNYILLAVFTFAESYVVGFMAAQYDKETVLMATYLTGAVVSALALYALQSKTEISYYGGFIVLISLGSLVLMFFSWMTRFHFFDSLLFAGGCVLSGLYFIYDIKMLMGKDQFKLSLDDYVKGAMHLYMDVIRIFINMLKIMGRKAEEEEQQRKRRR